MPFLFRHTVFFMGVAEFFKNFSSRRNLFAGQFIDKFASGASMNL